MKPIDYTDHALMKMVLDHAVQLNGWLRIGEPIFNATSYVRGGKRFDELNRQEVPRNLITVSTIPSNVMVPAAQEPATIHAGSFTLKLRDIVEGRMSGLTLLNFRLSEVTYIHPYSLAVTNREWLEKYNIGDLVSISVMDPNTFTSVYVETPLTQQMIDDNSNVIVRFALSTT